VTAIREAGAEVVVDTTSGAIVARHLVVCGGLHADRLAAMAALPTHRGSSVPG
jgi:glycine/D-amino acid oxidase-like deaminating enzyme